MTRAQAAKIIAKTPQGVKVPREIVAAALYSSFVLPDETRRFEDSFNVKGYRPAGPHTQGFENVELEFDAGNHTDPIPGALVFAAHYTGHAYRFGPVEVHRDSSGILWGRHAGGDGYTLENYRAVGCVLRWGEDIDGVRHGVECPQGAPWTPEFRFPSPDAGIRSARYIGEEEVGAA